MYKMSKVKAGSFAVPKWDNLFRFFLIFALLASLMIYAGGNVQSVGAASNNPMYVSFDGDVIFGIVEYSDDDIIYYDGATWEMFFDGSDVGLGSGPDTNAFELLTDTTALFVFFDTVPILLNGGALSVDANDIVQFNSTGWGSITSGTFTLVLDGPTVGLDTTAERIDALHALPDGSLLISTTGNPSVPADTSAPLGPTVGGFDEDILKFTPAVAGNYSSGTWSMYFDASAVGATIDDVDAVDVVGNKVYISTLGAFAAPGGPTGDGQDVFSCTISGPNCTFDTELYFDSSAFATELTNGQNLDSLVIPAVGPIAPKLTSITRQTPATSPTNANTLVFRVTFDENVTNVNAADFAVNGTTTATPTSVDTVSPSVYDVTVSGGNLAGFNGVVGLNLSAGNDITDLDTPGNPVVLAEPAIDETYTVDNLAPTVSSIVRANPSPTSAATVNFTVTFSEVVTGVDAGDFSLTTSGVTGATIQPVTGSGTTYTVPVNRGSGNGTIRLDVPNSATVVDLLGNPLSGLPFVSGQAYTISEPVTATFGDVPTGYWAFSFVERLAASGITAGCGNGIYCPESLVTRAQMAVFLLRGIHGPSYSPPAVGGSTGFGDVPTNYWAAAWIKQLAAEGITGGCGNGTNYCPDSPVTRAQMAIFLLRAKHTSAYTPPAVGGSTGFGDVPTNYWAATWIKQLAAEGITGGCGNGTNYCPDSPVTRAQMAVFLVRTFNLP